MKNTYLIGHIALQLSYVYDDFFASRIAPFQKDVMPDYFMEVLIESTLARPTLPVTMTYRDKTIYEAKDMHYIVKTNASEEVTHLISYTPDYRKITIQLASNIGERLPEVEYLLTGMMFFEMAIRTQMIPFHASAISYLDEAILFSAPSQTGKSTQADLWQKNLSEVQFINDDKPVIFLDHDVLHVSGTPWSGKTPRTNALVKPVKCILFLEQAYKNELIPLSNQDKLTHFFRNIHRPREEELIDEVLKSLELMIREVPIYLFQCRKDQDAFEYLYHALYRGDHL